MSRLNSHKKIKINGPLPCRIAYIFLKFGPQKFLKIPKEFEENLSQNIGPLYYTPKTSHPSTLPTCRQVSAPQLLSLGHQIYLLFIYFNITISLFGCEYYNTTFLGGFPCKKNILPFCKHTLLQISSRESTHPLVHVFASLSIFLSLTGTIWDFDFFSTS